MVCEQVADGVRASRPQHKASADGSDGDRASCRWCASQLPIVFEPLADADGVRASCPQQHKAPGRTKARLIPMVIEPVADGVRATWAHQGSTGSNGVRASCPQQHEAPGRTKARLVPMVIEPVADGVRDTWAHQGSIGSDGVRGNCRWCASREPASRSISRG